MRVFERTYHKTVLLPGLLIIAAAIIAWSAHAGDMRTITWQDLKPNQAPFEDPFEELTGAQLVDLSFVARVRHRQANGRLVSEDERQELADYESKLAAQGVDIDGLLTQRSEITEKRRQAAQAVVPSLDGARVRIAGYVLPIEFEGNKVTEFLLVPYVGACIHVPPPPANQIVHVVYPEGIEVNGLFTPVWITGTLMAEGSVQEVGYADGQAPVSVSYSMRPVLVEKYGG